MTRHRTHARASQSLRQPVAPGSAPQFQPVSPRQGAARSPEQATSLPEVTLSPANYQIDLANPLASMYGHRPVSPSSVQAKLTVGAVGDKYEQEADSVASKVVQHINTSGTQTSEAQRQEMPEEDELQMKPTLQRGGMNGGAVSDGFDSQLQGAKGKGRALDPKLQVQMGQAMGADFSGVKIHTDVQSDQLNQSIQAKAFTTGQDVFFRQGEYQPGSRGGQELIAHELTHVVQQQGQSSNREHSSIGRKVGTTEDSASTGTVIQRFPYVGDLPSKATWKAESSLPRKPRSDALKSIDELVGQWEELKTTDDKKAQVGLLYSLATRIRDWKYAKNTKYSGSDEQSGRADAMDALDAVVDQKLQDTRTSFRADLAPLVNDLEDAANAHDMNQARNYGKALFSQDGDFFNSIVSARLNVTRGQDALAWATYFFSAPPEAVGGAAANSNTFKAMADFSWLTKSIADWIIINGLNTYQYGPGASHVLQMLQHLPFRKTLQATATKEIWKGLQESMTSLRIANDAEGTLNQTGIDASDPANVDAVAQAVFDAFLNDLPISGLIYSTVTAEFQPIDYLLGNQDSKFGAPCMMLSSIFNHLFKMVMPNPPPVIQSGDARPLLTKKLAQIGTQGILTRETAFKGNVSQYLDERGYASVNRIFFGDGHIWLTINGKDYDPTLGISGPAGTVAAQVERYFTANGKYFSDGTVRVKRTSTQPPGGAKLRFDRTAVIEDKA